VNLSLLPFATRLLLASGLFLAVGWTTAVAQPVTVGIVQNQTMIPAGTYASGVWRRPNRQRPPQQGALWGENFQGQTVHPAPHREEDGTLLWRLDVPEQPQKSSRFSEFVISPAMPVTVFRDVSSSEGEQKKIDAFLGREIQSQLDSRIAEQKAGVKRIERQTPVIRRTESAIGGVTYYHVRSVADVNTSEGCEELRFVFDSWFTEAPGGPKLVNAESKISCFGAQATYLNPLGAFRLGESVFAVGEEAYYEGASAVIMNLSPQSVRVLLRNHWTQD